MPELCQLFFIQACYFHHYLEVNTLCLSVVDAYSHITEALTQFFFHKRAALPLQPTEITDGSLRHREMTFDIVAGHIWLSQVLLGGCVIGCRLLQALMLKYSSRPITINTLRLSRNSPESNKCAGRNLPR